MLAIALSLLMLTPGCTSPTDSSSDQSLVTDCEKNPTSQGCFEEVVSESDCSQMQVFTGDSCRTMIKPGLLSFGESKVSLIVGLEMQPLTPSFVGDAPSSWTISPQLPDGLSFDFDSGVISGTPTSEATSRTYTIIASNSMGIASDRFEISVLPVSVQSLAIPPGYLHCTANEECGLPAPSYSGGAPDEWHSEPPLPMGLLIGEYAGLAPP